MTSLESIDVYEHAARYSMGRCGSILVVIWHATPLMDDFVGLERTTAELVKRFPQGIGVLILIEGDNSKPPAPPVRKANADLVKRFERNIWGMARVLEGDGFKFTAVRLVLSTIELMSSVQVPEKTVGSVEEAVAWIRTISPDGSHRLLASAVKRIRTRPKMAFEMAR